MKIGRPSPNLAGQRFGRYVVVERAPEVVARAGWVCRCDCGTLKVVLAQDLKSGGTRSCGCARIEEAAANGAKGTPAKTRAAALGGRTFGRLLVVERSTRSDLGRGVWWRCRCDCGTECNVRADNLTTGKVRSCGCLRAEKGTEKAAAMRAALSKAGTRTKRVGDAFAAVFRPPPDTVHVDRPGARVVRGTRY